MENYLIVFIIIYLSFLMMYAYKASKNNVSQNASTYLFGDGGFGIFLSFLGISATLFSTFTLQGMPSFFKNHGVGAWVFLGVTDVCLASILLYFGLRMRCFARSMASSIGCNKANNLTEIFKQAQLSYWTRVFFVLAITIFIIPYITIQVKGASVLFQSALPIGETHLVWSIIIITIMLLYSFFGGIRAIFITDAVQGVLLLIVAWAVAVFAIQGAGSITNLFNDASQASQALMSTPGPAGILTWQFLLISFISISVMPYVQPQLATRVFIAKSDKTFVISTMALGVFALLVIIPTVFIGIRGASIVGENPNFLVNLLNQDVPAGIHALFIIGVAAAAMSTSDSQLMAVGTEWGSALIDQDIQASDNARTKVKAVSLIVAIIALLLAQTSFKSLVLFAINSFIGTSMLLPIVIAASVKSIIRRNILIYSSFISVCLFLFSLFGVIPNNYFDMRLELLVYFVLLLLIIACKGLRIPKEQME